MHANRWVTTGEREYRREMRDWTAEDTGRGDQITPGHAHTTRCTRRAGAQVSATNVNRTYKTDRDTRIARDTYESGTYIKAGRVYKGRDREQHNKRAPAQCNNVKHTDVHA